MWVATADLLALPRGGPVTPHPTTPPAAMAADAAVLAYVRKDFASLDPYSPVKPLDVLAAEIGVPVEDLVKLDANENLYGPIPQVMDAVNECHVAHIYSDPGQTALRAALATYTGVSADHLMAGSGSDELLDLLLRVCDPKAVVSCPPTFGMYTFLTKIAKATSVPVSRGPPPRFPLDIGGIAEAVTAGASLVFVASPNNPTGALVTDEEVHALCALPALIVLDEAYAEFAGLDRSGLKHLDKYPNLVILRTFSKWAALAGCRVGYMVARPALVEHVMAIKQPYNITVWSDVAARAAITHKDVIMDTQVKPMIAELHRMIKALSQYAWLVPIPTDANFVLLEVLPPYAAAEVAATLRSMGVLIRYYSKGCLSTYIRISAGRPKDTDRLLAAVATLAACGGRPAAGTGAGAGAGAAGGDGGGAGAKATVPPLSAVLLDMDGVLVEVSKSYRAAIEQTAAAFGVAVTQADVDAAKARGNANNDWVVAHHLIADGFAAGGTAPTLQQVTDEFERLYQGDAATPGLKALEEPLVTRGLLEEVRARCNGRLAVVTGRPRRDAVEAIRRFGWAGLFSAVVVMEDGPPKPDAKPTLAALQRLQVPVAAYNTVALFGDTVDDMLSAASAGILPIGMLTPGAAGNPTKRRAMERQLHNAGAVVVLGPGLSELPQLCVAPSAAAPTPAPAPPPASHVSRRGRFGSCCRVTKETSIRVEVNLDGSGKAVVDTGIGFLDHMLGATTKHGRFDLYLQCKGDVWIDDHHTAEDCGIAVGEAIDAALGARSGIARWGYALCPLDEALSRAVVDISSRPFAAVDLRLQRERVGELSCEMVTHVLQSIVTGARLTVHIDVLRGNNDHHRAESSFKAFGVALRMAVARDSTAGVPSTKGVLA